MLKIENSADIQSARINLMVVNIFRTVLFNIPVLQPGLNLLLACLLAMLSTLIKLVVAGAIAIPFSAPNLVKSGKIRCWRQNIYLFLYSPPTSNPRPWIPSWSGMYGYTAVR